MGWWFSKKEDHVEEDILTVKKRLHDVDENVRESFHNLKDDMRQVGQWIEHFQTLLAAKDEKIQHLEWKIGSLEQLEQLVEQQNTFKHDQKDVKTQSGEIDRSKFEQLVEHVQPFNRSVQPFMNVQPLEVIGKLTPMQRQVVGLLLYSGGPMDYEAIAQRLNINEITARRHLNDIRRAGIDIKRKVSDNNRKNLFFLDQRIREALVEPTNEKKEEK